MDDDPRIEELMELIDTVDEHGEPTSLALIARRVASYMEVVDRLRKELAEYHSGVEDLEARAENLSKALQEREGQRDEIVQMTQDAAVKASFATNTGRGAELRKDAAKKRQELNRFDAEYEADQARFKEVTRALDTRRQRLMETRDQVARRMNIIDALLQRAEIEWPSYFFEENKRLKPGSGSGAGRPVRRRKAGGRGKGRRIVVRKKAG